MLSQRQYHRSSSVPAAVDRGAPWQGAEHGMADDQDPIQRDIPSYPFPAPSRRSSLPRRNTDARHYEPTIVYNSSNLKRAHRKSASVMKEPEPALGPGDPITLTPTSAEETGDTQPSAGAAVQDRGRDYIIPRNEGLGRLPIPSIVPTSVASVASNSRGSHGSNSSSESVSTVTEAPFLKKDSTGKMTTKQRRFVAKRPNAFSFLDSDSPDVTVESIRQSMEEASRRSPTSSMQGQSPSSRSVSTISSDFRDDASDNIGDHETDRSTSPERGAEGGDESHPSANIGPRTKTAQDRRQSYEIPRIPRGNPPPSHILPNDFTPRAPSQGSTQHLPRPERLPLTGYELLASKLSTSSSDHGGPHLQPIYRRFETLNHRVLLHLQDEICELEEQLHRLDAADTQSRRLPNCIFPASRRAEQISELQWRRTDILGKIGFKLEQYNRVLSSFRDTQTMPVPALADINEYRRYLTIHGPIVEAEAHFLDVTDDLICVNYESQEEVIDEEAIPTPLPHTDFAIPSPRSPSPSKSRPVSSYRQEETITETVDDAADGSPIIPLSIAVTVAVIIPILTFLIIPGYLGRLTVIFLVGLGALGALIQGGLVGVRANRELFICVGLYGAVMAVIAGIVA
ncbi:hypothetical protein AAE478_009932 [Parahypoxylon ruwenzoriense]